MAGRMLVVQRRTGIFRAMHYTPNVTMAFASVEHVLPFGQMSLWGATVITNLVQLSMGSNPMTPKERREKEEKKEEEKRESGKEREKGRRKKSGKRCRIYR